MVDELTAGRAKAATRSSRAVSVLQRVLVAALPICLLSSVVAVLGSSAAVDAQSASDSAAAVSSVRIAARKLDNGNLEFGLQLAVDTHWQPRARFFSYATVGVGRWLRSSPYGMSDGNDVRVRARKLANGKVEFAMQVGADRQWLPPKRTFPYRTATVGRWLYASWYTVGDSTTPLDTGTQSTTPTVTAQPSGTASGSGVARSNFLVRVLAGGTVCVDTRIDNAWQEKECAHTSATRTAYAAVDSDASVYVSTIERQDDSAEALNGPAKQYLVSVQDEEVCASLRIGNQWTGRDCLRATSTEFVVAFVTHDGDRWLDHLDRAGATDTTGISSASVACALEETFTAMAPAVFRVSTVSGSGTAFHIGNGEFLTAAHVVAGVTQVRLDNASHSALVARVVGRDGDRDVALLRANVSNVPVLRFGDVGSLRVGATLVAVGYPLWTSLGVDPSMTQGIHSRLWNTADRGTLVQTDTPLNAGNSGGPLMDRCGSVVAIAIFGYRDADGHSYGVAENTIRSLLPALRSGSGATPAATGNWQVSTQTPDHFPAGDRALAAWTSSMAHDFSHPWDDERAELVVRCWTDSAGTPKELDIWVYFGGQYVAGSYSRNDRIAVSYRFGQSAVQSANWVQSGDRDLAFVPRGASVRMFLQSLREHANDSFVIRAWNFDDEIVGTITFDLSGSAEPVNQVRQACEKNSTPSNPSSIGVWSLGHTNDDNTFAFTMATEHNYYRDVMAKTRTPSLIVACTSSGERLVATHWSLILGLDTASVRYSLDGGPLIDETWPKTENSISPVDNGSFEFTSTWVDSSPGDLVTAALEAMTVSLALWDRRSVDRYRKFGFEEGPAWATAEFSLDGLAEVLGYLDCW